MNKIDFFTVYSNCKRQLLIFIYGNFEVVSLKGFNAIPNNQTFIYGGVEYIINNNQVSKL